MPRYDVVVIGAGAAGLSAGGAAGRPRASWCLVLEASPWLGGRGMGVPDEGFRINVGGHLVEDSGSGITKVFEHVGKELVHGAVSDEMPVWQDDRWISIRELYSGDKARAEEGHRGPARDAVRGARQVGRPPAARVDAAAHQRPGRDRALGVHRAARVPHRRAGRTTRPRTTSTCARCTTPRSAWPATPSGRRRGGTGIFQDLADAIVEHGGEVRTEHPVERVVIEDGRVVGVAVARQPRIIPNEIFEERGGRGRRA